MAGAKQGGGGDVEVDGGAVILAGVEIHIVIGARGQGGGGGRGQCWEGEQRKGGGGVGSQQGREGTKPACGVVPFAEIDVAALARRLLRRAHPRPACVRTRCARSRAAPSCAAECVAPSTEREKVADTWARNLFLLCLLTDMWSHLCFF